MASLGLMLKVFGCWIVPKPKLHNDNENRNSCSNWLSFLKRGYSKKLIFVSVYSCKRQNWSHIERTCQFTATSLKVFLTPRKMFGGLAGSRAITLKSLQ